MLEISSIELELMAFWRLLPLSAAQLFRCSTKTPSIFSVSTFENRKSTEKNLKIVESLLA